MSATFMLMSAFLTVMFFVAMAMVAAVIMADFASASAPSLFAAAFSGLFTLVALRMRPVAVLSRVLGMLAVVSVLLVFFFIARAGAAGLFLGDA